MPPSYSAKSTSWADETDDLDGDGMQSCCSLDVSQLSRAKLNRIKECSSTGFAAN